MKHSKEFEDIVSFILSLPEALPAPDPEVSNQEEEESEYAMTYA
jgi:hypothetical protein